MVRNGLAGFLFEKLSDLIVRITNKGHSVRQFTPADGAVLHGAVTAQQVKPARRQAQTDRQCHPVL